MSYTKLTEATIKTPNSETGLIADKDGILLNMVKTNIESWASAVIGNGAYRFSQCNESLSKTKVKYQFLNLSLDFNMINWIKVSIDTEN